MLLRSLVLAAAIAAAAGCGGGVTITEPANGTRLDRELVAIRGTTVDGARLVLVNREPATSLDGFRTWTAVLRLPEGTHDVTAIAYDARGGTPRASIRVTVAGVFGVDGSAMGFFAIRSSSAPPVFNADPRLKIRGDHARWRISGPPWARFSALSGEGPATVKVSAQPYGLDYGVNAGQVTVTDDDSTQGRRFPVSLEVRAADLRVVPASLWFLVNDATRPGAYSETISVTDEVNGSAPPESVAWTVQPVSAPWLSVTPASGGTSPPATLTVSVDPAVLQSMPWGSYSTEIFLDWHNAQRPAETMAIYVGLDHSLSLPVVDFASPYVGVAGRSGTLTLRGRNLSSLLPVHVGDVEIPAGIDAQSRIQYPSMPAGRYPVGFRHDAGFEMTSAELVVVPPSTFNRWSIPAPGVRERLIWDAERQALYGVNRAAQALERYHFSAGAWVADLPFALSGFQDADLAPDGRSLIAVTRDVIFEIDLRSEPWVGTHRYDLSRRGCPLHPARVVMANDGRALIIPGSNSCTREGLYDIKGHLLSQIEDKSSHEAVGSADGSRICAITSTSVPIFDSLTGTWLGEIPNPSSSDRVSIGGNGSRLIVGTAVFDRSLHLLGSLGSGGYVITVSRDSTRAIAFQDGGGQTQLTVYDLSASTGPFPAIRTVPLGITPSPSGYGTLSMATTHDDSTVFLSRDGSIEIVPLGP